MTFDFFTNKTVKYLFYKFNDYLLLRNLWTVLVRYSKIAEEDDKSDLKLLPKNEKKKSMKHNYKVARRIYCSIYKSTVEQFKMYVTSL